MDVLRTAAQQLSRQTHSVSGYSSFPGKGTAFQATAAFQANAQRYRLQQLSRQTHSLSSHSSFLGKRTAFQATAAF
eukprot:1157490-Pelagomonas_calceolata.AAC.5